MNERDREEPYELREHLLTVSEIADRARLSEVTVRRHIQKGALQARKICGSLRVAEDDAAEYLRGQKF